jgi:hypothetical protein
MPKLLGPKRLLASRFHLGREFLSREPHKVTPAIRQVVSRRGKNCGFGENTVAVGFG